MQTPKQNPSPSDPLDLVTSETEQIRIARLSSALTSLTADFGLHRRACRLHAPTIIQSVTDEGSRKTPLVHQERLADHLLSVLNNVDDDKTNDTLWDQPYYDGSLRCAILYIRDEVASAIEQQQVTWDTQRSDQLQHQVFKRRHVGLSALDELLDSGYLQVNVVLPGHIACALRQVYMQLGKLMSECSPIKPLWRYIPYVDQQKVRSAQSSSRQSVENQAQPLISTLRRGRQQDIPERPAQHIGAHNTQQTVRQSSDCRDQ